MIGKITTEAACAVAGMPFERVAQYLKRGQVKLEMDKATPRPKGREWVVLDVVKLAVLRELTDLGLAIRAAAEFVNDPDLEEHYGIWKALGCNASIMGVGAPEWFLLVVRSHSLNNPSIEATNSRETARDIVLPAVEEEQPKSAVVINCTAIAREVRRKLEAIGED